MLYTGPIFLKTFKISKIKEDCGNFAAQIFQSTLVLFDPKKIEVFFSKKLEVFSLKK